MRTTTEEGRSEKDRTEGKSAEQDRGRSSRGEKRGGKSIAPAPLSEQKCSLPRCNYRTNTDAVMTVHLMKVHVREN